MSDEQNVAEAPQQGAPAADAAPAAPKRRPGRPRKSAASSGKASSEASSDAAFGAPVDGADSVLKTPAKRRPGRPRKKAAPAQKAESAPAAKADAAAKAEPAAKPIRGEGEKRRRRLLPSPRPPHQGAGRRGRPARRDGNRHAGKAPSGPFAQEDRHRARRRSGGPRAGRIR